MRPLAEVMQQLLSPVTFERRTERKVRVEEDAHPPRTASVGGNPTQGMGCHGSLTSVRWADSGDFRGAGPSGLGGQTALQPDGRPAGHMFQAVSSTGRPEGLWKAVCCDSGGILASEIGGQNPKSRPHGTAPRAPRLASRRRRGRSKGPAGRRRVGHRGRPRGGREVPIATGESWQSGRRPEALSLAGDGARRGRPCQGAWSSLLFGRRAV